MFNVIPSRLIVSRATLAANEAYLTFDDGPNAEFTECVLDVLAEHHAKAAFFIVGRQAKRYPEILKRIISDGHSVHSHSTDHNYITYFRSPGVIRRWVYDSLRELEDLSGIEQRIFRPPGGIIPPPVWMAARALQVPLVLWNHRFYDYFHPWTEAKANKSRARARAGDIVLLHDQQLEKNRAVFLQTLGGYIRGLQLKGLVLSALQSTTILKEARIRSVGFDEQNQFIEARENPK